jgi:hypothetical protein
MPVLTARTGKIKIFPCRFGEEGSFLYILFEQVYPAGGVSRFKIERIASQL